MSRKPKAAAPRRIRLMLVDDHEMVRLGLSAMFSRTATIQVVGEAATAADATREALRLKPDVILMDLRLPDGSGLDVCRQLLGELPATRVLFLTSFADEEAILATLLARAAGYLLKDVGQRALIGAVEAVGAGQSILDQRVTQPVLNRLQAVTTSVAPTEEDLSPQETRVLALVVEGKTNRDIARALKLSHKTVKNYLSNAFQKMHVGRRSQAAALFLRRQGERAAENAAEAVSAPRPPGERPA